MADKRYKLTFEMSDGSTKDVEFTAPQGPPGPAYVLTEADKAEIAEMVAKLVKDQEA